MLLLLLFYTLNTIEYDRLKTRKFNGRPHTTPQPLISK